MTDRRHESPKLDGATAPHDCSLRHPPNRLALAAAEAAELLGISERHLWALHSQGRIPRPVALGRSKRWPVEELRAWLAAGSPPRDRWEASRKDGAK